VGLLERFHRMDEGEPEPEAEPSPETKAKVDAILGVLTSYLDPANTLAQTLFVIARRELVAADPERLDIVILGVIAAADRLRPFAPVVESDDAALRA
jgi:hypothetical protein